MHDWSKFQVLLIMTETFNGHGSKPLIGPDPGPFTSSAMSGGMNSMKFFVGGLPNSVNEVVLRQFCERFGPVRRSIYESKHATFYP